MPTVAEQQALFQALVDQGYDRSTAAIAAGNAQFAGNPILAALGDPRQRAEAIERLGGEVGAPRPFPFPPLAPDANPLTRQTYETLQTLLADPGTPDEEGYDALGRFQQSLVWGTPYTLEDYNDPNIRTFIANLQYNAGLQDRFSFLGDQLFPALTLFGLAAGGAALAGGAGAGAGGAGAGAGGGTGAGVAAGEAGSVFAPGAFVTGEAAAPGIAGLVAPAAPGLPAGAGSAGILAGTGTAASPGVLSQIHTLANTPLFEGGPSASQVYQGGALINQGVNTAQDPSAANVLGLAGSAAGLAGSTGIIPSELGQTGGAAGTAGSVFAPGAFVTGEAAAPAIPGLVAPAASGLPLTSGVTAPVSTTSGALGLKDILAAAPAAAGLFDAAGRLISGPTTTGGADPETEALYQRLRELAARSVPQAQALAQGGDAILRQRASGSSAAILRQIAPQVRQLREQLERTFHGLGQRFGQQGQFQVQREQGQSLRQAGEALQRLFTQAQTGGVQGSLDFLRNVRPALLAQLPNLQAPTTTPIDFAQIGAGLAQGATVFDKLFNRPTTPLSPRATTPAAAGLASGTPFFTPSSFAMLGSDIE